MIRNALTGEPRPAPATKPASQQETDFTAEGAPAPGHTSGTALPDSQVAQVATPQGAGTDAGKSAAAQRNTPASDMASVARALAVLWPR
jgi:hypothetical protein